MKKIKLQGTITALVTPFFKNDGSLDLQDSINLLIIKSKIKLTES